MKHIIFTRFAIGVQRQSFHAKRLAILRASLLRSMLAQTNPDVHWLLVTDCRTPANILSELAAIGSSLPHFHLRTVDPLVDLKLSGFHKRFLNEIADGDEIVFFSRVDDDDAVHRDFSAKISAFLSERIASGDPLPIAATWPRGLDIYVADSKGRVRDLPWLAPSIGLATRMSDDDFFNIMGTHWIIGERAEAVGGTAHVIEESGPMWAYLRHKGSDSSEFRRAESGTFVPLEDLPYLADFGVSEAELLEAHEQALTGQGLALEAVDGERGFKTRLETKQAVLSALRMVENQIRQEEAADRASMAAALTKIKKTLGSLMYSI